MKLQSASATFKAFAACSLLMLLISCGGGQLPSYPTGGGHYKLGNPYQIAGRWYYPEFDPNYDKTGTASWYGSAFHGKPTANGEIFDRHRVTAAHPTLPLPSMVEVTNLKNGRSMTIRVNDRGPFVDDRLIDLSEAAAKELGFWRDGLAPVRVRFIKLADASGTPPRPTLAKAPKPAKPSTKASENRTASLSSLTPAASNPCRPDQHFIQVATLQNANKADKLANQVRNIGPVWRQTLEPSTGTLYRIRIGPLAARRDAFEALSQLRKLGYQDAYVADCRQAA